MHNQLKLPEYSLLEPKQVWGPFAQISAIPRPSGKEGRIRAFLQTLARQHGLESHADETGNLVIRVPATSGCESAPTVVLQAHLDMVCEKTPDSPHDFSRDPIRLMVGREAETGELIVRADQTTLGADNGLGLAMALGSALSPEVVHGPLELLFTVEEETGLNGARGLSADFFRGRIMINLDAGEDDTVVIGCVGGADTTVTCLLPESPPAALPAAMRAEACRVDVTGLHGGHSGGDIHLNRGNAIQILARVLLEAGSDGIEVRLAGFRGGSRRNVIPREASAVVVGPRGMTERVRQTAATVEAEVRKEQNEENCSIQAVVTEAGRFLDSAETRRALSLLAALPHGVLAVLPEAPRELLTSSNMATVETEWTDLPALSGRQDGSSDSSGCTGRMLLRVGCMSRSLTWTGLQSVVRQVSAIGTVAGATVECTNMYGGWEPDPRSSLLARCTRVHQRLFSKKPKAITVHGGLECGIIGAIVPGMEMIALGARVLGAHSPDERAFVGSVERTWAFLCAVLRDLSGA
jgi:dipeptidase D